MGISGKTGSLQQYVYGAIDNELYRAIEQSNLLFEEYTKKYYIVFY